MTFPVNIAEALMTAVQAAPDFADFSVVSRPVRPTDPARSIGIFPVDWQPELNSHELGNIGPTLSTYAFRIHLFIKHSSEVEGRNEYAIASKNMRVMLYHGNALRVALGELIEVTPGLTERLQRYGVRNQRFLNNELSGQFIFLSATDFWAQTETINTGGI